LRNLLTCIKFVLNIHFLNYNALFKANFWKQTYGSTSCPGKKRAHQRYVDIFRRYHHQKWQYFTLINGMWKKFYVTLFQNVLNILLNVNSFKIKLMPFKSSVITTSKLDLFGGTWNKINQQVYNFPRITFWLILTYSQTSVQQEFQCKVKSHVVWSFMLYRGSDYVLPLKKTSCQSHGIILSEMLTKFRRRVREN